MTSYMKIISLLMSR